MNDIENPIEFSAFLLSLKQSVDDSIDLLEIMLDNDQKEIDLTDKTSKNIVALLMCDAVIKDSIKYSCLQDFDFTKDGKVVVKNIDKNKIKNNLEFMKKYLDYRIEYPIDLASC